MRIASLLFVVGSLVSSLALGCSSPADDEPSQAESALTPSTKLAPAALAQTKADLRAIAYAHIDQVRDFDEVRSELQPLVDKLARHFGTRSAASKVPLVAGAWHQIWSDFPYPGTPLVKMDPRQVYQVVSPDGHYYNLGDERALLVLPTTGILRGAWELDGQALRVHFTDVGFRFGRLKRNTDLVGMADDLESGALSKLGLPGGGAAPKGPVGIYGSLETLYVDADLRIERGGQEDYLDAAGNVLVPGTSDKLFILDRVNVPVK